MKKIIYLFITIFIFSTGQAVFAQNPADYGCTDPAALNYNPDATIDNGSCMYYCDSTYAYFWFSSVDDSLVIVQSFAGSIGGPIQYFWDFGDGSTSNEEFPFHFYNESGTYDLCLTVTAPGEDSNMVCTSIYCDTIVVVEWMSLMVSNNIYGCMDPNALNYNPLATINDNSCIYSSDVYGCTDPIALNFNPLATINDGSCIYDDTTSIYGCMDPIALNYNPEALIDDGSCIYMNDSSDVYGCMDSTAINYNPLATIDDGSCFFTNDVFGCTDTSALNYNPLATIDNGSCSYYCDSTMAYFYVSSIDESTGIIYVVSSSYSPDLIINYLWDFGDGQTSMEEFPVHEYESEGFYMLCLTIVSETPNGNMFCTSTYCDTIGISQMMLKSNGMTLNIISENATGIEQQIQDISELNLYPNPANNTITISYNVRESEVLSTTIYDISGRTLSTSSSITNLGTNISTIDISTLPTGMYQIELRSKNSRNILSFQVIK